MGNALDDFEKHFMPNHSLTQPTTFKGLIIGRDLLIGCITLTGTKSKLTSGSWTTDIPTAALKTDPHQAAALQFPSQTILGERIIVMTHYNNVFLLRYHLTIFFCSLAYRQLYQLPSGCKMDSDAIFYQLASLSDTDEKRRDDESFHSFEFEY